MLAGCRKKRWHDNKSMLNMRALSHAGARGHIEPVLKNAG